MLKIVIKYTMILIWVINAKIKFLCKMILLYYCGLQPIYKLKMDMVMMLWILYGSNSIRIQFYKNLNLRNIKQEFQVWQWLAFRG